MTSETVQLRMRKERNKEILLKCSEILLLIITLIVALLVDAAVTEDSFSLLIGFFYDVIDVFQIFQNIIILVHI